MKDSRYVFAGNRMFVLEKMIHLGLNIVKIWAVKGSYLQSYLEEKNMVYFLIEEKEQFIHEVDMCDFDYFISNGLPIILPIIELKAKNSRRKFINIHPSLLPQLRGKDPIPGALLFKKDSGATCHLMDEGIDSGAIISQVKIENTDELDAGLLYQLSFMAESDVFELAFNRSFVPYCQQQIRGNEIYYSFRKDDLYINLEKENIETIIAKIKAFSTKNKGAYFEYQGEQYKCIDVVEIKNSYLIKKMLEKRNNSFVMIYENKMIYKKDERYLKLSVDLRR